MHTQVHIRLYQTCQTERERERRTYKNWIHTDRVHFDLFVSNYDFCSKPNNIQSHSVLMWFCSPCFFLVSYVNYLTNEMPSIFRSCFQFLRFVCVCLSYHHSIVCGCVDAKCLKWSIWYASFGTDNFTTSSRKQAINRAKCYTSFMDLSTIALKSAVC